MNRIFILIFISILTILFIFGHGSEPVRAQAPEYTVLAPLPGTVNDYQGCNPASTATGGACGTNLSTYILGMFRLLIGVAGGLAVIQITIGGVQYMSTDAISGKQDGRDRITQALYGLLLAIACWLILNTINPNILRFDILSSTPSAPPPSAGATGSF